MREKFEFDDPGAREAHPAEPLGAPPTEEIRSSASGGPSAPVDISDGGLQLAAAIEAAEYQPVVLFGTAASGKTSLLLSLLSILRTETSLDASLFPGDPILSTASDYGQYLAERAESVLGRMTQEFIEGSAAPATKLDMPFFVPVVFRPRAGRAMKFAFMESNGEWYRVDRTTDRLFPRLKRQIEDFISSYEGGIIFIHLVPYTQRSASARDADPAVDAQLIGDASLAICGALQAYEQVRANKRHDQHIMLVTKWDMHRSDDADRLESLSDDKDEVETVVARKYATALNAYRGLSVAPSQLALNGYCAGIMNERGAIGLRRDHELRASVLSYPVNLWRWLYKSALLIANEDAADPFPVAPSQLKIVLAFKSMLNRLF